MPPIEINSYDFNFGAYENLKANFIATRLEENRWGKKFARLYRRHEQPGDPDGTIGIYDFTKGMRAATSSIPEMQEDLDAANTLLDLMRQKLTVDTEGTWSIVGALRYSYMVALLENVGSDGVVILPSSELRGLRFALCLDDGDDRRIAWWPESGIKDGTSTVLKPLMDPDVDWGVRLIGEDGTEYGHYAESELIDGTTQDNALELYSVEDREDERFDPNQDERFEDLWGLLITHVKMMIKGMTPEEEHERASVLIGLDQFLHWLEWRVSNLEDGLDALSESSDRTAEDLELLDHLGMIESLNEQISDPGDIERIWLKFEKEIFPTWDTNEDGELIPDENYEWWLEDQFDELRGYVKDFQQYCEPIWGEAGEDGNPPRRSYVRLRSDVWDLSGHKIYHLAVAFIDIGVDLEDPPFWQQLWNFLVFVFSIYSIIVGNNPLWMKALMITAATMSFAGVLSPELALLVTIVQFSYGLYNADFSAMSNLEIFKFAIKNVEMLMKMKGLYDMIELKNDLKDKEDDQSVVAVQEQATTFIYTTAYSQYDDLYTQLYRWDDLYRTRGS